MLKWGWDTKMTELVNLTGFGCLTDVLGAQDSRLIETVLLSTHNICFGSEIRKLNFRYLLLKLHTL